MPSLGIEGALNASISSSPPGVVSVPSAVSCCTAARPLVTVKASRGDAEPVRTPSLETFVPTGALVAFMSK